MGAFFLSPVNYEHLDKVEEVFRSKGFKNPSVFLLNDFSLLLYQKQAFSEKNFLVDGDNSLYVTGTVIYKGMDYKDSLKLLFGDLLDNRFEPSKLLGNYFILFKLGKQLFFYIDPSGNYSVYQNKTDSILSSSFLATATGSKKKLKINNYSVIELLVTGNLIGPQTIFQGIERIEPALNSQIDGLIELKNCFSGINSLERDIKYDEDFQLDILRNTISNYESAFAKHGAITGLTGGLDSRLLFLLFDNLGLRVSPYSTWRKNITKEFSCAEELATAAGYRLKTIQHRSIEEIPPEELNEFLEENLVYNDGIIRTHQIWLEEIKGKSYSLNLLGDAKINISGVGGEQYRNSEYLIDKFYDYNDWIRNEVIFRYVQQDAIVSELHEEIVLDVKNKISLLLGLPRDIKLIDAFSIKRYYNEIYNPANRTVRNNIENQLYLFLSPFTEFNVSRNAYLSFPFLGSGPLFQKNMIYKVSPKLSYLKTNYGYAINERIPFRIEILPVIKRILGLKKFRLAEKKLLKSRSNSLNIIISKHPALSDAIKLLNELNLPINLKILAANEFLYPLLVELGLLLKRFGSDIEYS